MAFDSHANFGYDTVATAPSPATSGTSLVLTSNTLGATPPFNAIIWPAGTTATASNAEIVRVTANSTGTLTIARAQESTTAQSITAGYQIANSISTKIFTDIESALGQSLIPTTNATYTLGDSSHYYANTWATRYNLNSSAYIDGSTSGSITTSVTGRQFITVTGGSSNSVLSGFVVNNADTSQSGTGMLFSAGATTSYIGGITVVRLDGTNTNSVTAFRVLANGALTASDPSSPFSITGVTAGNNIVNVNADIIPYANATNTIGNSTRYFTNLYVSRLNLNSTAYLDGGTAGTIYSLGNIAPATTGTGTLGDPTHYYNGAYISAVVFNSSSNIQANGSNLLGTSADFWGNRGFKFGPNAGTGTDPLSGIIAGINAYVDAPVFVVRGYSVGQTADLMRWQGSDTITKAAVNASGQLNLLGTSGLATHTLTLGSAATGIAFYNTSDQTTNYERVLESWVSNVYTITTAKGGTGTLRSIRMINVALDEAYVAKTGTYTLTTSDSVVEYTSGTVTVTLPTAISAPGRRYTIKNSGTGAITIATTSSQTIDGVTTYSLATQYKYVVVMSNGANYIVVGNN